MHLACGVVGVGFVTGLILIAKFGIQYGFTVRPVFSQAVFQTGGLEVPACGSPLDRIINFLPASWVVG
jgi:hypothetical protein